MITELLLLIWVLAFFVPVYWCVPGRFAGLRLGVVSTVSALLLYLLSPVILATVVAYLTGIKLFDGLRRAGASALWLKRLSWGFFLPLLAAPYISVETLTAGLLGTGALGLNGVLGFALLGISYTAIRSFMIVRQGLEGYATTLSQQIATLLFFGSFSAGPISNAKPWAAPADRLSGEMALIAIARFIWGAAAFLVLSPVVQDLPLQDWLGLTPGAALSAWVTVWQNFIGVYLDFSGYTHIAIACGLLFGVQLPENFNWPLRATSIQEFWQRWHRSLGTFIGTYLFKPLVRSFGKPMLAIFAAFVFVGIWHSATVQYFLWGVGHGAALALNMAWNKRGLSGAIPAWGRPAALFVGWAFTLSYVSMLSALANAPGMGAAVDLLMQLFGRGG